MSDFNWCHGPECHKKHTVDRERGVKGSKVLRTRKVKQNKWNTNTEVSEFKIIDDEKNTPTLKEAQDFVGGYVECITWPNGDLLIVNEEGKLMGLPLNPEATMLWRMTFDNDNYVTGRKDFVVGPAIYIKKHALKNWA